VHRKIIPAQSFLLVRDADGNGGDRLSAARTSAFRRGALAPGFKLGAAASGACRFHVPGRVFVQDADAPRERRDHVDASRAREQVRDAAHQATVDELRRLVAASALELEKVADPLSLHLRRSSRDAKHWPGGGKHLTAEGFRRSNYGKPANSGNAGLRSLTLEPVAP
jgi:hypothetical protein